MTDSDKDVLVELIKSTHEQLEQRDRIARAQQKRMAALIRARQLDAEKQALIEANNNKRQKKWNVLSGIGAVVIGIIMSAFIASIWKDMDQMSQSMQRMEAYMAHMDGMSQDMHAMNTSMGKMENSFGVVKDNMGDIQVIMNDMNQQMTPSVVSMSKDVAQMRIGVNHMANDTDAMGKPFKTLDRLIPW